MPTATDYSTTYVYEIVCKDTNVQTKFLGYTTNFLQRKYNHKRYYQQKDSEIYTTMANNGGFDNWEIRLLAEYNCKDSEDARMMLCNYNGYILEKNKPTSFRCDVCDYECNTKSNFNIHCKSTKHITNSSVNNGISLSVPVPPPTSISSLENLVIELVKQNQGQQEQMAEIMKQNQQIQSQMIEICNRPTQVNNTTNNNNSFRLNVFLNETCKEAIDVNDFIDNMVITVEEIMRQATMSYEEGFAAILKDRLCDKLTIETRPIHFIDIKRETIIYKDKTKNAWVRDDGFSIQQNMCREMTKQIGNYVCENMHLLPKHIFDNVMKNSCPDSEKQRSKIMRMIMPFLCLPKEGTPVGNRTAMR